MDKRDEALEYIDKALKLVPNYEPAIEAKSKLSSRWTNLPSQITFKKLPEVYWLLKCEKFTS